MTESDITGLVGDLAAKVGGASNLTTTGAIPKVASSGVVSESMVSQSAYGITVDGGEAGTVHDALLLKSPRSWSPTNDGLRIVATASNGTEGTHDFGAIAFKGDPGTGDGGAAVVEMYVGGASSGMGSGPLFLKAAGGGSAGPVSSVGLHANGTEIANVTSAGLAVNQKDFGGSSGLLIKGNSPTNNWPNMAFSTHNSSGADVIGVSIATQIISNTADAESMDLSISTRDAGTTAERLRIDHTGDAHFTGNITTDKGVLAGGMQAGYLALVGNSTSPYGATALLFQNATGPRFVIQTSGDDSSLAGATGFYTFVPSTSELKHVMQFEKSTGNITNYTPVTLVGDDYGNPVLTINGQKSTTSTEKWGEYTLAATANGLVIKNSQTGLVMCQFGAGPASGTENGSSGNGKDGDTTIPYDLNLGGILQMSGGSPASGKFLQCNNSSGGSSWANLAASDIPALDAGKTTTGIFDPRRLGSDVGWGFGANDTWLRGDQHWTHLPVSAVAMESGSPFEVNNVSGTVTISRKTQTINTVFAGAASGDNVEPTFRALTVDDLPMSTIAADIIVTLGETYYTKYQVDTMFAGFTGATGPQGPQGDQGPQGPQGDQGPQGNDGASVDYSYFESYLTGKYEMTLK